tara:strand:+ start:37277 stop:37750 length:474 start_codon:yes stop_codon:yes gene_type:complete
MNFIETSQLSHFQKEAILELWNNEYPKKLNYPTLEAFEKYLEGLKEQSHIVMIDNDQKIRGWYFSFIRESEKWFAIILDTAVQGDGLGRKILNIAKTKESELNGWVIDHNTDKKRNGEFYRSPLNFYVKNGFTVIPNTRLELEILSAVKIEWRKKDT